MFVPENDIESALAEAAKDGSRVPEFLRQLLDAEVLVAYSCDRELEPDGSGAASIPAGAHLTERGVTQNGSSLHAFFTAPSRVRAILTDNHVILPDKVRDLFERFPGALFVLNPGSDVAHQFAPEEVTRLLAGNFESSHNKVKITKPTNILLSQPSPYPTELVDALGKVFAAHPMIRAAYLAQADFPGGDRHPMIGIEIEGEWAVMRRGLWPDLPKAITDGRNVDFVPHPGGPISDYLSRIEPFYRRLKAKKSSGLRRWYRRGGE